MATHSRAHDLPEYTMKHTLVRLTLTLISSIALSACLPSGTDSGGGGGGGGVEDTDVNNGADAGGPNNTTSTNNATNNPNPNNTTPTTKTCPDGSVVPTGQSCICPTSIDDCDDGGAQCGSVSFSPGSPCGTCTVTQINACGPFDGCCPSGCSPDNDDDCAGCGDGQRDPGETCDGDCPRSVDECPAPSNACSTYSYSGSASSCSARCTETSISRCIDRDGCCPSGCDFESDDDCSPPVGTARHGAPCLGNETACENISSPTICVSQSDITLVDPLIGMLVNPGGICTPLDCTLAGAGCRNGSSCVTIMGIFGTNDPISVCLEECADSSSCSGNMTCSSVNILFPDGPTYCI